MKTKVILIGIIAILGAIGGYFVFGGKSDNKKTKSEVVSAEDAVFSADQIIKMTPSGFSPSTINIKKDETVAWVNEDSQYRWPASDIHPTHEIYSEFDPKEPLAPGEAWAFTFEKAGAWNFHDHLRPNWTGTVTVVD